MNKIAQKVLFSLLLAFTANCWALLTPAQLITLKAAITANATWNAFPNNSDGAFNLAVLLNTPTASFIVWRTRVPIGEVGRAFNGTELAGLTTGNQSRLQTLAVYLDTGVNPSLADNRAFFDDVFSGAGGTLTRANLLTVWKRTALEIERIFATGTGTTAAPATMSTTPGGYTEGRISPDDVQAARNS